MRGQDLLEFVAADSRTLGPPNGAKIWIYTDACIPAPPIHGYKDTQGAPMDLRILVVEDSETTRRIIRAILETREWKICGEAKNGQTAIKQFRKLHPDIVILDFTMPALSGIEVAARLSKIDPLVPLILFTISEVGELYEAARGAGIYAVVSKARAWDLIGTIESAIAHLSDLGQPIQ
jgi:two-component system, chemotaxis family, chemotaxis protein CheY